MHPARGVQRVERSDHARKVEARAVERERLHVCPPAHDVLQRAAAEVLEDHLMLAVATPVGGPETQQMQR